MKKLIAFLFILSVSYVFGEPDKSSQKGLSKENWEHLRKDRDYVETWKPKKINPSKTQKTNPKTIIQNNNGGNGKFVVYGIVVLLLLFFIFRYLGTREKNSKIQATQLSIENLGEIEARMHELSLEDLLSEAEAQKNYRLALRLNFLIIIKLLSQEKIVRWKKDKTNWDYHAEIGDKIVADTFKKIVINFESFWYGEHPLTDTSYTQVDQLFSTFRKNFTISDQKNKL